MVQDIMEIYRNYPAVGIVNRSLTKGVELDLVKNYIEYRKATFKANANKKMAIFLEAKISNAYPDIVFVEYDPNNYTDWNSNRAALDTNDYKILFHLYTMQQLQASDFVNQLGVTWKSLLMSIEKLYDADLIVRKGGYWCVLATEKITAHKAEALSVQRLAEKKMPS